MTGQQGKEKKLNSKTIQFRLLVDDAHGFGTFRKNWSWSWRRARLPRPN